LSRPSPLSWPPPPFGWILMPVPSTLGLTIQLTSSTGEICKITVTLMWQAGVVDVEVELADKEVVAEGVTSMEPEEATRVQEGTQKSMLVGTRWRNGANYPPRSNRKSDVFENKRNKLARQVRYRLAPTIQPQPLHLRMMIKMTVGIPPHQAKQATSLVLGRIGIVIFHLLTKSSLVHDVTSPGSCPRSSIVLSQRIIAGTKVLLTCTHMLILVLPGHRFR